MINYVLGGATESGFHSYLSFGQCPKRATLNKLHQQSNGNRGTSEGSVLHAYAELYYGGHDFEPEEVIFDPPQSREVLVEAARVWRQFRDMSPRDEWGEVVSREELLSGPAVEAAVGISPYTMRADMVVRLDEEACERLREKRQIDVTPGYWGMDHKFLKSTPSNMIYKYPNSLQFTAYMLGWNAAHPEMAVEGWIPFVTIKTKEVKQFAFVVPLPNETEIKALKTSLKWWSWIKENAPNQTNPLEDYCFGWGEPCHWWKTGQCDRGEDGLIQIGGTR